MTPEALQTLFVCITVIFCTGMVVGAIRTMQEKWLEHTREMRK